MKSKNEGNPEDIIAQISNAKTKENVLLQLYTQLRSIHLSNVQRNRCLKVISGYFDKNSVSKDIKEAAISTGLIIIQSELKESASPRGVAFRFVELCWKIVSEYVGKENAAVEQNYSCKTISKALEVLSILNKATVKQLFEYRSGLNFTMIFTSCLRRSEFQLHALLLLDLVLTSPPSEAFQTGLLAGKTEHILSVYPLLFNAENETVRSAALSVLHQLPITNKQGEFWTQLKEDTQKKYCKNMIDMVNAKQQWPAVWQYVVNMFGDELRSGCQLINHLLEVIERSFKHSDFEWTRVKAFECWNTLIDNFKNGLKNKKRIDLIMIPMKANNHRIESLARAKLDTYIHLFVALGEDLISNPDILLCFFSFCFGSEKSPISPAKSYPALHEKCVGAVRDLLSSPFSEKLFEKTHKELIPNVVHCFLLEYASFDSLRCLWIALLGLVKKCNKAELYQSVFSVINSTVIQAERGENGASSVQRRSTSPLKSLPNVQHLNEELGKKIVWIMLHKMVHGDSAVHDSIFLKRPLYIGSYDVMSGTPAMLILEWILTPALMISAGDSKEYKQLFSKMISLHQKEKFGFMDFSHLVLKKIPAIDNAVPLDKRVLLLQCTSDCWCCLAEQMVEFIKSDGNINQGDAAEHDFQALYSMFVFPSQYLYSDLTLLEKCSKLWSVLFYKAYQQAELVTTSSGRELCEQICSRLAKFTGQNKSPKQLASVYHLLTCVLKVASDKFRSNKVCLFIQQHVSDILKDCDVLSVNQEVVYDQVTACVQNCLELNPGNREVVENVAALVCCLLKSKMTSVGAVDKLCSILGALKKSVCIILQHGASEKTVDALLWNIKNSGNSSHEIKVAVKELCDACKTFETEKPLTLFTGNYPFGSALSPSNRILNSPKQASRTSPNVLKPPSSASPKNPKAKLRLQLPGSGTDEEFVRIHTPPKKLHLTEHQKEIRRQKRDIPALYQDLSQDTQSLSQDSSQDFVALPPTPKAKSFVVLDEDAVADIVNVDLPSDTFKKDKFKSPKSAGKSSQTPLLKSDSSSFKPPAGFSVSSKDEVEDFEFEDGSPKKDDAASTSHQDNLALNTNANSTKLDKSKKTLQQDVITDKSVNATLATSGSTTVSHTTRSGKVLKRASLAPPESESGKRRKSNRKSLPANCSKDLLKNSLIETIVVESDTENESVSSITSDVSITSIDSNKSAPQRRGRPRKTATQNSPAVSLKLEATNLTDESITINNEKDNSIIDVLNVSAPDNTSGQNQNLPPKKLVGGKILTRSRSNSNLGDSSIDEKKIIALGHDLESKSANKGSFDKKIDLEVKSCSVSAKPDDTHTVDANAKVDSTSHKSPITKDADESTSNSKRIISSPVTSVESKAKKVIKSGTKVDSPCTNSDERGENSCGINGDKVETANGERGVEESQEIIESSQEPLMKLLRPCAVSLGPNLDAEPNTKVEIDNVVIVKGPDASSPYKIHCKDLNNVSNAPNSACRSLVLEDKVESPSPVVSLTIPDSGTPSTRLEQSISNKDAENSSKKSIGEDKGDLKENINANGAVPNTDEAQGTDCDSRPDWMHEKKSSPPNKSLRPIRNASSRSQVCMERMRSYADVDFSTSPPKGGDMSPVSSPVQIKKASKSNVDSSSNSSTSITKRSSRAAQLLGLGQAAAARGGETVVSSSPRPVRSNENTEDTEVTVVSSASSNSSSSNPTSSVINHFPLPPGFVPSPSVRRSGRVLELENLKSSPYKSLEDEGHKGDWVPSDPCPTSTPDSSILKRKRVDDDVDVSSPKLKKKRVSFRDPPCNSLLKYEFEPSISRGTLFRTDMSMDGDKNSESLSLENQIDICARVESHVGSIDKILAESDGKNPDSSTSNDDCKETQIKHVEADLCSSQDSHVISDKKPRGTEDHNKSCEVSLSEDKTLPIEVKENVETGNGVGNTKKRRRSSDQTSVRKSLSAVLEKNMECASPVLQKSTSQADKILKKRDDHKVGVSHENSHVDVDVSVHEKSTDEEGAEVDTQGQLDDLHRMSSLLSPIYPPLVRCTHPIHCIASELTTSVWEKALIQEFSEKEIFTVGDIAGLTEEKLERLSVKRPKRTSVCHALMNFEKRHSTLTDSVNCKLLNVNVSSENIQKSIKDVLACTAPADLVKALLTSKLSKESEDNYVSLLLRSVPIDLIAETYISRVSSSSGMSNKQMTAVKQNLKDLLTSKMDPADIAKLFNEVESKNLVEALLSNINEPSKLIKETVLSKLSPSYIAQNLDQSCSEQVMEALMCKKPSKHILEVCFSKLSPSDIAQQLDNTNLEELTNILIKRNEPSDKLKKTLSSLMTSSDVAKKLIHDLEDVAHHLSQKEAEDVMSTLLRSVKKPSEKLIEHWSSFMTPLLIARLLNQHQDHVAQQLNSKQSEELMKALKKNISKPSQELILTLSSWMTPMDIAKLLNMHQDDVAQELNPKQSEELMKALKKNISKPSQELIQTLSSWMTPVDIAKLLNQHQVDVAQELNPKQSDELMKALKKNIAKPSQDLLQALSSWMTPVDIAKLLNQYQVDVSKQLDQSKSEELIKVLLGNISKPSQGLIEECSSLMAQSDNARQLSSTSTEMLQETLYKSLSKQGKESFLSKIEPSDIVRSSNFKLKEILKVLPQNEVLEAVGEYISTLAKK